MADRPKSIFETGSPSKLYDAIILGAGISGLVSAAILKAQGYHNILVLDEYGKLGGNHINCDIGSYTFDIGTFIFQDDSPLLAHFPELLPYYLPIEPSFSKLTPQGRIAIYPLSIKDDVLQSGIWGCFRIGASLLYSRLTNSPTKNARNFARYWMGDYLLTRSGLQSYMTRFFGITADRVDIDFAQKRMLWIKELSSPSGLFRHLTRRRSATPPNRQLARPRSGLHDLYTVAANTLRQRGVDFQLGCDFQALHRAEGEFVLQSRNVLYRGRRLISTIPVNRALSICGLPCDDGLQTVTLISLFFSFSGRRGFDTSIFYNFSYDGKWKRLAMYSDFYGTVDGREYFGVEVISSSAADGIAAAEQDFRSHVTRNGLFQGDLLLEGSRLVTQAYPIYTNQAQQKASRAIGRLAAFGIESFGRQGGFDYQPTARVSTQNAETHLQPSV